MKKGEDKMVRARDSRTKALECVRECVIPGLGNFAVGQEVVDEETVAKIADNPCFRPLNKEEA